MISRIELIAKDICEKLKSKSNGFITSSIEEQVNYHLEELKEDNLDNHRCIHYLLYITCQFNMLEDAHKLLELNLYKDIDQPLKPKEKHKMCTLEEKWQWIKDKNHYGKTLLGLVTYLGHFELVKYLVEVRLANVNLQDSQGNTPLHQVVFADSHRNKDENIPNNQDKIAKYLINNGGDICIKNKDSETAYDKTVWCAPNFFEKLIGRRIIDSDSYLYDADKVRPIFEKEMIRIKTNLDIEIKKEVIHENVGYGEIIYLNKRKPKAKSFKQFCLENAIKDYVKEDKIAFGFSSLEELHKSFDSLSEEEAKKISAIISSQEPAPYSSHIGLIYKQLPKLAKQSAAIGVGASIVAYYETQSILMSLSSGAISAYLAFSYLTNERYKEKCHERTLIEQRMGKLQEHDRFFQPRRSFTITTEQIKRFKDNLNHVFEDKESGKFKLPGKLS